MKKDSIFRGMVVFKIKAWITFHVHLIFFPWMAKNYSCLFKSKSPIFGFFLVAFTINEKKPGFLVSVFPESTLEQSLNCFHFCRIF
jgi:hypothetical protein